nr:pentapeptide repeat-containing protein [Massilia sp. IC2-476]
MARKQHPPRDAELVASLVKRLKEGPGAWNRWRAKNPEQYIDFRGANLRETRLDLSHYNLSRANFSGADIARLNFCRASLAAAYASEANLEGADFSAADLSGSYFHDCRCSLANFTGCDLRVAKFSDCFFMLSSFDDSNMRRADFAMSHFSEVSFNRAILAEVKLKDAIFRRCEFAAADLRNANLIGASFVDVRLSHANLSGARVYGTSAWSVDLTDANQSGIVITPDGESEITVDSLRIAQFVYVLLTNTEVRDIIDTIASKVVLIIGRFSSERKPVLDALRVTLRSHNFTPIIFDFTRPNSRSFIETVATLAAMSKFVIADLTDAKVVLQELQMILSTLPSVPVQPLIAAGTTPSATLIDFITYSSFLNIYVYDTTQTLLDDIYAAVIAPAEQRIAEIVAQRERAEKLLKSLTIERSPPAKG